MRINEQETSSRARWSLWLALFTAQLIIVTILLHRFASLATPITTNLIVVSLLGAAVALLLAVLAFIQIWNTGQKGTGTALAALLVCLMIFAVPLYHLPNLIRLPAINDITTDLLSPPQFRQIAALRQAGSNSVDYPGNIFISAQAKAYPDISTLLLERSYTDSFALVHGVIEDLGWDIVSEQQPGKKTPTGYIEAVDHSRILGFSDDIVVRVRGSDRLTRIDMRSASRYGRHDFGANANRIREVFGLIKTRIARAEARRIDSIERRRIERQALAARKLRERERARRLKKARQKQAPIMLPEANFNNFGLQPQNNGNTPLAQAGQNPNNGGGYQKNGIGNQFPGVAPRPHIQKRRKQKLKRSQRRKRRKKWIPFSEWP